MRRQRGSVAVFAMVMVVSTMIVVIVTVSLAGALRMKQNRLEDNRIVLNAFDAGVDIVKDMAARGVLRLPQTVSLTSIPNVQESLTLTDVSNGTSISILGINITTGSKVALIQIAGTITYQGAAFRLQRIIGRGVLSTVWQYAIYTGGDLTTGQKVTTGSAGLEGDMWVDGKLTLTNSTSHIGGDLTATDNIWAPGVAVDGTKTANSPQITFPTVNDSDYWSDSHRTSFGSNAINGYVFGSGDATGYPILYQNNNPATISGAFSGNGTIYVQGNVTIAGNVTVSAGSHVAIVVHGNVTISSGVSNVGAYIYCSNKLTISGSPTTFGSGIVTNNLSMSTPVTASFDPFVRDNPPEAYKLHLPGVWP